MYITKKFNIYIIFVIILFKKTNNIYTTTSGGTIGVPYIINQNYPWLNDSKYGLFFWSANANGLFQKVSRARVKRQYPIFLWSFLTALAIIGRVLIVNGIIGSYFPIYFDRLSVIFAINDSFEFVCKLKFSGNLVH